MLFLFLFVIFFKFGLENLVGLLMHCNISPHLSNILFPVLSMLPEFKIKDAVGYEEVFFFFSFPFCLSLMF